MTRSLNDEERQERKGELWWSHLSTSKISHCQKSNLSLVLSINLFAWLLNLYFLQWNIIFNHLVPFFSLHQVLNEYNLYENWEYPINMFQDPNVWIHKPEWSTPLSVVRINVCSSCLLENRKMKLIYKELMESWLFRVEPNILSEWERERLITIIVTIVLWPKA